MKTFSVVPFLAACLLTLLASGATACGADLDACELFKTQDACAKQAGQCTWNGSENACQDKSESGPARN